MHNCTNHHSSASSKKLLFSAHLSYHNLCHSILPLIIHNILISKVYNLLQSQHSAPITRQFSHNFYSYKLPLIFNSNTFKPYICYILKFFFHLDLFLVVTAFCTSELRTFLRYLNFVTLFITSASSVTSPLSLSEKLESFLRTKYTLLVRYFHNSEHFLVPNCCN